MTQVNATLLADILRQHQQEILGEWVRLQLESASTRRDLITESELRQQSRDFLAAFALAISSGERVDSAGSSWTQVRELLARVSDVRARQGFTASETATFIFSLKHPLFSRLAAGADDAAAVTQEIWAVTQVIDKLGLYTTEMHQKSRDEIILRQQQEMLELSTPVVTMWDGVLALPLIGTLDSART